MKSKTVPIKLTNNLDNEFTTDVSCRVVHCKKEPYDVYIGRPSKWGNPFTHLKDGKTLAKFVVGSREAAVKAYREWITNGEGKHLLEDLSELKNKVLGCWCHPKSCHGDVLSELVSRYYNMRITPKNITKLESDQIFVFGSNQSGIHGKGAAKTALGWGAIYGQAEGLQGNTYGIPTKDKDIRRTLSIDEIEPYVDSFVEFAKHHPKLRFLVTEIGCGLAGLKPEQVAPLFKECEGLKNVWLPERFWDNIKFKL